MRPCQISPVLALALVHLLLQVLEASAWVAPSIFSPLPKRGVLTEQQHPRHGRGLAALSAKKKKLSMAEKRKRRAKKLPPLPLTGKPVNFDKEPDLAAPSPEREASPQGDEAPPQRRAKDLLDAQRDSVNMLTYVKECGEALPVNDIQQALSTAGYFVADDFLHDNKVISQLQSEGDSMLQGDHMDVDLDNVGYGEYIASIKGGEEQYKLCPRLVEFVVSLTKHLPKRLEEVGMSLDASVCMATLRVYDRKTRLASLELMTGAAKDETPPERSFDVVTKGPEDRRKLTLLYYPIAEEWRDQGGITIEKDRNLVDAKRDRLVLLASDTCSYRREPWKGDDDLKIASCIELHFVQTNE